jgi:site-specific recombinase XerD
LEQTKSSAWDQAIDKLAVEITIRHYSRKTLKTYAIGDAISALSARQTADELFRVDVKEYLTYLAVKCRVASSTQNQALMHLLFLFRHVLDKEFGDQRDVPAPKNQNYIPVMLSRPEIDAVTKHLDYLSIS